MKLGVVLGFLLLAATSAAAQSQYEVVLTWQAPASSSDPVAGYDVYRQTNGGAWTKINSSLIADTLSYNDPNVNYSTTYSYYVVSVDAKGATSVPSNTWSATIPTLILTPAANVQILVSGLNGFVIIRYPDECREYDSLL